jgi:hypothetical protein
MDHPHGMDGPYHILNEREARALVREAERMLDRLRQRPTRSRSLERTWRSKLRWRREILSITRKYHPQGVPLCLQRGQGLAHGTHEEA